MFLDNVGGTYEPRTISNPSSPMFQAIASSPTGVRTVSKWSSRMAGSGPCSSRAVTTAAAAPSPNIADPPMIVSGSFEVRTCNEQSSTQITSTTAVGVGKAKLFGCLERGGKLHSSP